MLIPSKENNMINSKKIGNIGEAQALAKLVNLGIPVYLQFGDNEAADYIIIVDNKPLKVQVKTSTRNDRDKVVFDLLSSTQIRKNGVKHIYTKQEVDLFICYDLINKKLFTIKNTGNLTSIIIRYEKPKNGQTKNIHFASDYLLCVETLHEISNSLDKEKVQTTM